MSFVALHAGEGLELALLVDAEALKGLAMLGTHLVHYYLIY